MDRGWRAHDTIEFASLRSAVSSPLNLQSLGIVLMAPFFLKTVLLHLRHISSTPIFSTGLRLIATGQPLQWRVATAVTAVVDAAFWGSR